MSCMAPYGSEGDTDTRQRTSEEWEARLYRLSRHPRPAGSRPSFTMILPASAQIPTPNREFLLTTPSEGVSCVATVAEHLGWSVEIVDMRLGVSAEEAAARAVERGGVVAMPTFADSYPHNRRVLELVKGTAPEIPCIIGGSLISSLPEPLMKALPADYAVLHEGELTLSELLEHIASGGSREEAGSIAGLAARLTDGSVRFTPQRAQIRDLDAVPIPNLFLYPSTRKDPRIPELGLTTARGCYARCTFCFVNFRKMRFKSPERVGEEVRDLQKKHDVRYLYINDLTFTADLRRTRRMCEVLKDTGIVWSCSTRVERAHPGILRQMRDSGCRDIWYGVESVDQNVLNLANKRQTVDQIRQAIRQTSETGIKAVTNFIIGLPGETEQSLQAMLDFVKEEAVTPASVKYLSPFPGTPIYEDALRRGIIRDHLEYLEHLAERHVNDEDDAIYNVTDLPESVLRDAYRRLNALREERIAQHFGSGNQGREAV